MFMFAEVILPLPLYSSFTYEVPEEFEPIIQMGSRVLVQFGKKKYYTGIVEYLHSTPPSGYEVKPLMAILDASPVVRFPQIKMWRWIADYYLCSVGEVFKAAVPTGLKPESETYISYNKEWELPSDRHLTEQEAVIIQLMEEKKRLRISEIENELKLKGSARIINHLLELGALEIDERVVEKYRPKKVAYVELCCQRSDNDLLHAFFDNVSRSRNQEKTLIAWLDLSGWMRQDSDLKDVEREHLLSISGASPAVLKAMVDKGIFRVVRRSVNRFNAIAETHTPELPVLTDAQQIAADEIRNGFRESKVTLLHGVTGSGKTEIYSHLMAAALADGNQVLYLVPEISLTTQLTDRLRKVFGDRLLIYHSKFSDNERVDIWKRLLSSSEPLIILGVRSSVFLPFSKLGLVIVDEEHESSYKQYDPAPRYNARDAAIVLATMHGAKVLLGSATPSVETYYKALTGKYHLVSLSERFKGASLPDVEIVDMKDQRKRKLNKGMLSAPFRSALRHTLEEGKQAIVFQNRRGFAPVVVCNQCGWTPKCNNCDVSMVYHKNINQLRCHYCGFSRDLPKLCPACGQNGLEIYGYGTERIAEELHKEYDGFRVARMDLDTTRNKDAYQEIIEEFANHETDILVGTQMVSKGLDFGEVKVVGVVNADTLLNFPDFRSNERAFNMLEQVAGRAGRRDEKGTVFIQTTQTASPVLRYVKSHDYAAFYNEEIEERRRFAYPPFTKVINIYIKNKDAVAADVAAVIFAKKLREIFGDRVLGPEKPFVSRVALWYLQSIMLKVESGASMKKVKDLLRQAYAAIALDKNIKSSMIYYDVDPV
ncbi:MAG: primosomal protein N' [Muribaculaceae bacterium]|nr:primosomal protein N' [Muribaculaceae bacterium]